MNGVLSLFVKADAFQATNASIGCSKCVGCALNNIRLENGSQSGGKSCTTAWRCICCAPKEAIEYGKRANIDIMKRAGKEAAGRVKESGN